MNVIIYLFSNLRTLVLRSQCGSSISCKVLSVRRGCFEGRNNPVSWKTSAHAFFQKILLKDPTAGRFFERFIMNHFQWDLSKLFFFWNVYSGLWCVMINNFHRGGLQRTVGNVENMHFVELLRKFKFVWFKESQKYSKFSTAFQQIRLWSLFWQFLNFHWKVSTHCLKIVKLMHSGTCCLCSCKGIYFTGGCTVLRKK